jgi:adenine-specific DNA-methyltransferase
MANKQKLELTWIGKENRPKLEPRILLEVPTQSYHAKQRVTDDDIFDNRLIFGDNLLALKALEHEFAGKVKCIFIDPPYNTGSAFEHYDDGVEHSIWLCLIRDRLELLSRLLHDDGSLWISIDDNESPYLRVLADEIFGRANFVATVVWQKIYARDNRATISTSQDYVHVYAKNAAAWKGVRNLVGRDDNQLKAYRNPDSDPRGLWKASDATAQGGHGTSAQFYEIVLPTGEKISPPPGLCWRYTKIRYEEMVADGRIWFGSNGRGRPAIKRFLSEVQDGVVPTTWWPYNEVGHNQDAKREILALFPGMEPFATPKPERLLKRVLDIATNPGDLVLDSFAGSGTTGAVAQKMGRRWIMIELGEHIHSHIIPRLKKVIDGDDLGGVTEAANWKGGGGFRYFKLAPSLLARDKWDNWVISKEYNAAMLAEAICKLEGFTYAPSETLYWQQGYSTERDFLYVTTAHLTSEQLQQLSEEVGRERTLLVLCTAFRGKPDRFPNLTVKKIPTQVLSRCEWGHDDYSLQVENLPKAPPPAPPMSAAEKRGQQGLFSDEVGE